MADADAPDGDKIREDLASSRGAAPAADKEAIAARNKAALEARRAKIAEQKAAEAAKELPEGWRRVESRSRKGEFVYENIHTEERQAWFPDAPAREELSAPPAPTAGTEDTKKEELKKKNAAALAARKAKQAALKQKEAELSLPAGWIRTESKSRPGETVYENTVTGERQAWFPDEPAISKEEMKKQDLIKKNKEALAARKKAMQAQKKEQKDADAKRKLPAGWKRVESRSRPGEYVYENTFTDERQAWFPEEPAAKPLPEGWRKVESRSYPGEFVYENVHTLERQAWEPTEPASTTENQVTMPTEDQAAAAKAEPAAKNIIAVVKAVYDFTATKPDEEIDMLEGDVIQVEYKADNGWWVGVNTRTKRNGIFPGTYVEDI
eukprot:m.97204 g.97204  ORF g.97204 m.97204 type:complete len:380 (-) comp12391_c0_seq1:7940-9079(-)